MNEQDNNEAQRHAALCKKLNAARTGFHAVKLAKSGRNEFAGYDYFEMSDFIPAALVEFDRVGLCGIVSFAPEVASLTIVDTETGAQTMITSPMREAQLKGCHPIQNLGAVETYQRRYLWATVMELIENDIVNTSKPVEAPKEAPRTPTPQPPQKAAGGAPASSTGPSSATPEWQTWRATISALESADRNGKTYTNVTLSNGKRAVTTDDELATICESAREQGVMMEFKVKKGQKGAKTWWWLEDLQEIEAEGEAY